MSTSKEAFGTAGPEYAADRNLAMEGAERVIQIEKDRLAAAAAVQKATADAVQAGNVLLNEANDLTATGNQLLRQIAGQLGGSGTASFTANLAATAIRASA